MYTETIGNRIEALIKEQKINQKKFAESIKADATHINKIIKGKSNPSESLMYLICKKYNVSFDWLKQGIGKMYSTGSSNSNDEALEIFNSLDNVFQEFALVQLYQLLELQKNKKISKDEVSATQENNSNLIDISWLPPEIKVDFLKVVEDHVNYDTDTAMIISSVNQTAQNG